MDHMPDIVPHVRYLPSGHVAVVSIVAIAVFVIYKLLTRTDVPYILGLPEIPGALPITGHLTQLGDDHATVCEKWWRQYGNSVFQIRLGNTRAVIVNSFEDCKKILVSNSQGLIDRPKLYTFHGLISSTQGFTIGSSPWDESCRNKRKAASTTLSKGMMKNYYDMFDLESYCILRDLHRDSKSGEVEVSIRPYIQRYALNTTLTLCYGIRMDAVYDDLLREILEVGSAISLLRSASENYQDYVPILRYLPNNEKNRRSKELRERRDKYLNELLDKVRGMIKNGTEKPCISAAILKDEETRLTGVEVSSICLSLVSGGFETIPGTLVSCIGSLSTPAGQIFQDRAYAEIRRMYPTDAALKEAWATDFEKETVPYLNAIVKEAGRYYTVSNMSLPRKTMGEVRWGDAVIPKGTMVLINAQAGNHDTDYWGPTAATFDPERWLTPPSSPDALHTPSSHTNPPHLSFGAGSRSCPGALIASKLIYAALFRLLSLYRIEASVTNPPNTDYVDYNAIKSALVALPRDFGVRLVPRGGSEGDLLGSVLDEGRVRTAELYKE
ncbi:Phenylacetate 2-hydroxylase [Alternaria arborescens]|uniref:Phenylacetate 2-hydroxylase n=1 Tax=Alternaria arborescens TaxID=156630 RepID=UPI001074E62C|nr:Phenylacetate 2-hydroxylase [Alternaria arborescens]RYO26546.1 Phenylacetate 2-hydroxylase [Alternaria arborescens]